jgi:Fur family transcriptional regulator, ferric uptake regulator
MQTTNQRRPLTHIQGPEACPRDVASKIESVTAAPDIIRRVRDEARRKSVRWTNQRQVIVETFIGSDDHITVEDLHHRVRVIDRTISAATVYRTINMLVEMGVASKRHFGTASASFECEVNKDHHDHFVCESCGKIIEFHNDKIEALQESIAKEFGCVLNHHRLELYGTCADCLRAVNSK